MFCRLFRFLLWLPYELFYVLTYLIRYKLSVLVLGLMIFRVYRVSYCFENWTDSFVCDFTYEFPINVMEGSPVRDRRI